MAMNPCHAGNRRRSDSTAFAWLATAARMEEREARRPNSDRPGFIVCVETRLDGRVLSVDEVTKIDRPSSGFRPEELGLTLAHGKAVLHEIQKVVVAKQS